jgi:hypothetical protein
VFQKVTRTRKRDASAKADNTAREVDLRSIIRRHIFNTLGRTYLFSAAFHSVKMSTYKIVMIRHGESEWNQASSFMHSLYPSKKFSYNFLNTYQMIEFHSHEPSS